MSCWMTRVAVQQAAEGANQPMAYVSDSLVEKSIIISQFFTNRAAPG